MAPAVHALISSSGNVGATVLADFVRERATDAEGGRWDVLPDEPTHLASREHCGKRRRRDSRRSDGTRGDQTETSSSSSRYSSRYIRISSKK